MADLRRYSPACERNQQPILQVLLQVLPPAGTLVEIASGTGMHAAYLGPRLPGLTWQPTDLGPLDSIRAWRQHVGEDAFAEPLPLDVTAPWPVHAADAVFCANMIHIAPWQAALGLLDGAAAVLPEGGPLVLYGPFLDDERETSEGNLRFDASLRQRDPRWGIRRLQDVTAEASARGLVLHTRFDMPANNRIVVFRRS